jgi:hypothetical protein
MLYLFNSANFITLNRNEQFDYKKEGIKLPITLTEFNRMFSMPRVPGTALNPGQCFDLKVPPGKKILITDIYIENLGGGHSLFHIMEQTGPDTFEIRYTFRTAANKESIINFTTGLKLGDVSAIAGRIRIENDVHSKAGIISRVNGIVVG